MLTSNNQYLRPDYLSPLPTTLDAKKSPLALLAQTCSNIGADNPNHKPLIPPLEKVKDSEKPKSEKPFPCYEKSTFKPYEPTKKEEIVDCEKNSPPCKVGSPDERVSPNRGSEASCDKRSSPADSGDGSAPVKADTLDAATPATLSSSSSPASLSGTQCTLRGLGYSSNSLGLDLSRADPTKDGLSHLGLGMYKSGLSPLANCTGCGPVTGGGLPVDASMAHSFPAGISQGGMNSLRPGGYSVGSGLSTYLGYARVKTATGSTTLVPLCRDPYCTNCQLGLQGSQLPSACASGCTQCSHDRLASSLGNTPAVPGLTAPGFVPAFAGGTTSPMGSAMPGLNASLYPMLSRPNICSWMVGDTYCGKRFTTSEDLLQHLRTHTSISVADSSSIPLFSASVAPGSLGAACPLSYSSAPSLTSAGLRRTYPTSISPVSSLSVAGRYHPYKHPIPTLPGTTLPSLPHPSLSMYYSPYSLYGQRLGPPVHP